jgi:hypothetical protein
MRFFKGRRPEFRGYADSLIGDRLFGWASDRLRPRKRLRLEVYCAGTFAGAVRADVFRADLAKHGIGDGYYGFSFDLPSENIPPETIAVKVAGSDYWLFNSVVSSETRLPSSELMNSARKALPTLYPGLSMQAVSDADIEIAAALQKEWRAHSSIKSSYDFIGRKTMWDGIIASRHRTLLDLLRGNNPRSLAAYFVGIQKSSASEGLTQGERSYRDFLAASPDGRRAAVTPFHDMLASLVQYMALDRAECAEQEFEGDSLSASSQRLVARIESALGHAIVPPAVFDGLFGLSIDGRILHGRDIQALYAALRAIEASAMARPHICEIGGGFGTVAYYAWLRGGRQYSIVDLPSVSAMQYFYLRKTLPDVPIRFLHPSDANEGGEGINLLFASHMQPGVKYPSDLVLNCDSFPEMGDTICRAYFALIGTWTPLLLSINQEANREHRGPNDRQTVVGNLLPEFGYIKSYRFRSWIRKGFVEELWRTPLLASSQ